jgi:DNA-binding transcriptional MocR family regulator
MAPGRRQELLALAERHGFLVVEDDIYARLAYDMAAPPPLKALDRSGAVVHISSFSKVLMPGLRIGYVVASPPLHERLLSLRRATDLCNPPLLQRALGKFLHSGGLKRHLRRVLPIYRERRDALLAALQRYMPQEATWTRPVGGFCCWLTLPRHPGLSDLQQAALARGWAFAPGEVFLAQSSSDKHLRLSFGAQNSENIRSGIEVLSELIRIRLAQNGHRTNVPEEWTPLV